MKDRMLKRKVAQRKYLQVGEVVRLKSGGPKITVSKLGNMDYDPVECKWFNGGQTQWGVFPQRVLIRVRKN